MTEGIASDVAKAPDPTADDLAIHVAFSSTEHGLVCSSLALLRQNLGRIAAEHPAAGVLAAELDDLLGRLAGR